MTRSRASAMVTAAVAVLYLLFSAIDPLKPLMAVLGLALLVAPAYIWCLVLLGPRIEGFERIVVIAGLALVVPILGGLALAAAGILLHRTAWVGLLAGATIAGDAVLLIRGEPDNKRMTGHGHSRLRIPTRQAIVFCVAALISIGAVGLARAGAAMQSNPGFTELSLVPLSSQASLATLDVTNHQGAATRYRLVLLRNGHASGSWELTLADGQTWQREFKVAAKQNFAANLYMLPDTTHPFRQVTLAYDGVN